MHLPIETLFLVIASAVILATTRSLRIFSSPLLAQAPQAAAPFEAQGTALVQRKRSHGMVIQVDRYDPAIIKSALCDAENLIAYYEDKGEEIEVEFVALGQGVHMLRNESSLVKDQVAALCSRRNVTFSGCGISIQSQSRQERKSISLMPQAQVAAVGIGRIAELQERGWIYIRS